MTQPLPKMDLQNDERTSLEIQLARKVNDEVGYFVKVDIKDYDTKKYLKGCQLLQN